MAEFLEGLLGLLGGADTQPIQPSLLGTQVQQAPAPVAVAPITSLLTAKPSAVPSVEDVSSAIARVEASMPSKGFLKEISRAESRLGQDSLTYRQGYFGGPMQVDKIGFEDTQDIKSHPKLMRKYAKIEKDFGIKWQEVVWEDLTNPLHSAIAARLLLSNVPGEIPSEKSGRAGYWKKHYNSEAGAGTVKHFLASNK
jgi:hypothetical protein